MNAFYKSFVTSRFVPGYKAALSNRLFLVISVLSVIFFSSCSFQNPTERLPKTPENIPLESFVPEKSSLVFSLFPTTIKEKALFQKHLGALTQGYENGLTVFLFSKIFSSPFAEKFTAAFVKDNSSPALVAVFPDETKQRGLGFFAASRLQNQEGLRQEFLNLKTDTEKFTIREEGGKIFFDQKQPELFGLLHGSYLFLSSSPEFFPDTIPPKNPSHFLNDKKFLEALKKAPTSFSGYAFFQLDTKALPKSSLFPSFLPKEAASIMFFSSEEEGFRLSSFAKIPDDKNLDPLVKESVKGAPISLAEKVISDAPIFYAEGFNFANQLRIQKKVLAEDPFFKIRQGEGFFQDLEKKFGFSFEDELFPVLSRNYAILVEDQGKILPGISLIIDAGAKPSSGEKILKQFDHALSAMVAAVNFAQLQEAEVSNKQGEEKSEQITKSEGPAAEQKSITANGNEFKQIIFYPDRLSQKDSKIPLLGVLNETWEITYGRTNENLLIISTREKFAATPLAQHIRYAELLPQTKGFLETDHAFLDPEPLVRYGERLVELGKSSGHLTTQQLKGFEVIKKILSPIEGFISGTRRRGKWIENQGFLKLQGP